MHLCFDDCIIVSKINCSTIVISSQNSCFMITFQTASNRFLELLSEHWGSKYYFEVFGLGGPNTPVQILQSSWTGGGGGGGGGTISGGGGGGGPFFW